MKGKKTENRVVKTNNVKKEKAKLIMGIAMMVFAVAVAGGTYAYYQSTITGTVSGTILSWNCTNGTGSLNLNGLKPGSYGSLTFKGKSTNFITNIKLELAWTATTYISSNFSFYKTKTNNTSYSNAVSVGTSYTVFDTKNSVAKNTNAEFTVYYYWPLGTAAESAPVTGTSDQSVSLKYRITCTEVDTVQG